MTKRWCGQTGSILKNILEVLFRIKNKILIFWETYPNTKNWHVLSHKCQMHHDEFATSCRRLEESVLIKINLKNPTTSKVADISK